MVGTKEEKIPMCANYFHDVLKGKMLGGAVSFIIVIINLILKVVIIASITWVGEDTNSE